MMYGYNGNKHTFCRCLCDCGNEKIIDVSHLKRNKNISCGCMSSHFRALNNRSNEIGLKYNRLLIIDIDYSQKPSVAKCLCECGNTICVSKSDVISRHTKSCGCLQSENTSIANQKDFSGQISQSGVRIINKDCMKNGTWYWNCICPICGNVFSALPAKVLSNHTTSCGCKVQSSKERIIENHLIQLGANYKKEYRFSDCKYKYTLPFDFAIFDDKNAVQFLIEYDGEQHFKAVDFYGGESHFKEVQLRDNIKTNYCITNNILLLRFNYKDTNEHILKIITNTIYP